MSNLSPFSWRMEGQQETVPFVTVAGVRAGFGAPGSLLSAGADKQTAGLWSSLRVPAWLLPDLAPSLLGGLAVALAGATFESGHGAVVVAAPLVVLLGIVIGSSVMRLRRRWNGMKDEHDRMRIMLDRAPIGIALFDVNRKVLQCNPAFQEIYGGSESEIVGQIPPLPESQRERWRELVDRLRSGHSFVNEETVRTTVRGEDFYARISGSPVLDERGAFVGLVGFIAKRDRGDHSDQLAIRTLETLVLGSEELMVVANFNYEPVFVNNMGRDVLGLKFASEQGDFQIDSMFAEGDRKRVREILGELTRRPTRPVSETLRLRHLKSGGLFAASCTFFAITDPLTEEVSSFALVAHLLNEETEFLSGLKDQANAFSALFRNAPVPILLLDPSDQPIAANERLQEILGYSNEQLRSMQLSEIFEPSDNPEEVLLAKGIEEGVTDTYQVSRRSISSKGVRTQVRLTIAMMEPDSGRTGYRIVIVEPEDLGR